VPNCQECSIIRCWMRGILLYKENTCISLVITINGNCTFKTLVPEWYVLLYALLLHHFHVL